MQPGRTVALLLCFILLLCPAVVLAQEGESEGGRGEGFQPEPVATNGECPATFGPIITEPAIPVEKGKFVVQPTFSQAFTTDVFSGSWKRESAGGDYSTFRTFLKLTYGLFQNLEVYTVVPYVHNWASNVDTPGPRGERAANFGGLGDMVLNIKYQFVQEGERMPAVSAMATFGFPTGHYRRLNPALLGADQLGNGSYQFLLGLNMSKYIRPFIIYGNLWYVMSTDFTTDPGEEAGVIETGELDEEGNPVTIPAPPRGGIRNHPRDSVFVNLAVEYPITKKFIALLELTSKWDAGRIFGAPPNVPPEAKIALLPALEYMATDKFSLACGVNIDLYGKNSDAAITPVVSLLYAF